MGKFDGILLCTDLDGTLLKDNKTISQENLDAIEYFKSEGGYFTFVTGRMPFYVSDIYNTTKPNAPFGCINGGGLYDYHKQEYIWHSDMPEKVMELVRCIDEGVPDAGIQVNTFYKTYFAKENEVMAEFREITKVPNLVCDYNAVDEPIAKILFGAAPEDLAKIQEILYAHPMANEFDFIRSEMYLYEILPKGIGKGTAIRKLVEYLNIDADKTVAIGDYNNDISMFHAAKAGVAVSNACPEALEVADYVTVSNEEHAIAQVIQDIEDGEYI